MLWYVMSLYIILYHVIAGYIVLCYVTLYYIILYYIILNYIVTIASACLFTHWLPDGVRTNVDFCSKVPHIHFTMLFEMYTF